MLFVSPFAGLLPATPKPAKGGALPKPDLLIAADAARSGELVDITDGLTTCGTLSGGNIVSYSSRIGRLNSIDNTAGKIEFATRNSIMPQASGYTIVWVGVDSSTGYHMMFRLLDENSGDFNRAINLRSSWTRNDNNYAGAISLAEFYAGVRFGMDSPIGVAPTGPFCAVFVVGPGLPPSVSKIFINGVYQTTTAAGGSDYRPSAATGAALIVGAGGGTLSEGTGLVAAWNGLLPDALIARCLYSPESAITSLLETPKIWIPAAGSAAVNGSITLTGAATTANAGALAATGTAALTLIGAATTSAAGTLTATGAASATLTGTGVAASTGAIAAAGTANAAIELIGASTTASAGVVSASAGVSASATLSGVTTTSSPGSIAATGGATATLIGAGATADASGVTAAAGGSATATLTGTATTASPGALTAAGTATTTLTGAATTADAGAVTASNATHAAVTLTGAAISATVGALAATGDAQIIVSGIQLTSTAGAVSASATTTEDGTVTLTGAGAIGSAGTLIAASPTDYELAAAAIWNHELESGETAGNTLTAILAALQQGISVGDLARAVWTQELPIP